MTLSEMSGARFSACGKYRRLLWRVWDDQKPLLMMLLLNPSTAGAVKGDPTVTRQIERAKRLGCGGLLVANAYDLVSTDPKALKTHPQPLTADNDVEIREAAVRVHATGGKVIAGWGKHCTEARESMLIRMFEELNIPLWCIAINDDMSPGHPLYVPYDATLRPWPVF